MFYLASVTCFTWSNVQYVENSRNMGRAICQGKNINVTICVIDVLFYLRGFVRPLSVMIELKKRESSCKILCGSCVRNELYGPASDVLIGLIADSRDSLCTHVSHFHTSSIIR